MTTINHHDIQHRISSSKRTMINNFDQLIDNKITGKPHHSTRSSKLKHSNLSSSKPESGSEDIYTTQLNNKGEIGDADEESTAIRAIMTKTQNERIHRLSIPSNNSAIHLQQQGTGDHHHSNTKQHKSRNKTIGKYHEENIYRWRLFMYILTIVILAFVSYRFLLTIWPKPKKTLMKQLIDDLFNFFTP